MKQQDIAIIIVVAAIAGVGSYFLVGNFISPSTDLRKVRTVSPISTDFRIPTDRKNFNQDAINPTVRVNVDENDNSDPFKNRTQ